jgi:hypothetical protein
MVIAGAVSMILLVAFGSARINSSGVAGLLCAFIAFVSIKWLDSPYVIPRFLAACACCAMVPTAVGFLACFVFGVDLRAVDHVLLYPRFITEVDTTQLVGRDGALILAGSTGWRNSRADWSATLFFGTTLVSTILLYRIALRAYPKLTSNA